MVDLFCGPFVDLIDRMRLEFANQQSIFDLPVRKWYSPPADAGAPELTVRFHDQVAGNPVGPASGPQSQMAQNLVLSWLAGSRIMELKTIQVDDELRIARPCIDATNIGYNIEFSQELRVHDSLDQYVQGAMLIHMLRYAPQVFGNPFGELDWSKIAGETIYDMSIGYDLAGIKTDKVRRFIDGMIDARESVERLRDQIPSRYGSLRDLDYPTHLSRSVTLSTFHGCPAEEIERICEFLLSEADVDCIVKMNPPMLGKEELEHLLFDVLGYTEITVNPGAYTSGLQFDESIEICQRLETLAASRGRSFGAKFSNTLEVVNHRDFFPPEERVMYLSGQPLHVITLTLADRFRQAIGHRMPISFSAGVDRHNFANMVACGFVPVTTCTDLLKVGGFGRLPPYLENLQKDMEKHGARTIDEYILRARGQSEAAAGDPTKAGFLNTSIIAAETRADERYRKANNSKVPRRIDSHLVLFDCITCDKCIPVCPNDANFVYETAPVDLTYRDVQVSSDGSAAEIGESKKFSLERKEQIANFADYCNHCGNCDTFCPEYDGPYLMKPAFFGSREAFEAGAPYDGFFLEAVQGGRPEALALVARIDGKAYRLEALPDGAGYCYSEPSLKIVIAEGQAIELAPGSQPPRSTHRVDIGRFHAMVSLLRGITDATRVHPLNTRLLAMRDNERL